MAKLGFWGYWVFIPSVDIVGAPGSGRAMGSRGMALQAVRGGRGQGRGLCGQRRHRWKQLLMPHG
jgi:hypothetical protein